MGLSKGSFSILNKLGDYLISRIIAAIFARRTNQLKDMDKALETIRQMHADYHELSKLSLNEAFADKRVLIGVIERLTTMNRTAMAEMATPIGLSCRSLTHFQDTPNQQIVDEPMAVVMRSKEDLQVGAQIEIVGVFLGVDTVTGACRVLLSESGEIKRGKITDPALKAPHNIYTAALNDKSLTTLSVKPVMENGEIAKLYVSDAKIHK